MARQSRAQQQTVERVMHEFKHGDLETSRGRRVRNPKQAIAIALHEAGASNQESPARNRRALARTKARERGAEAGRGGGGGAAAGRGRQEGETRAALYAEARRRGIPGRSAMGKEELRQALRRSRP